MLVLAVLVVVAETASAQGVDEFVAPGYVAFPRVEPLLTRSRDYDRFDLRLQPTATPEDVRSFVLTLTIDAADVRLVERVTTAAAKGQSSAVFSEFGLAPILGIPRYGRMRSLVPWEYDGFTFTAEVRERGPDGPVVYRYRDPNKVMGISPKGLFDAYGAWLLAGLVTWFLVVSAVEAYLRRDWRRDVARFAAVVATTVLAATVGVSRYCACALLVAPLMAACLPIRVRAGLVRFGPWVEHLRRGSRATRVALLVPGVWVMCLTIWGLAWHHSLLLTFQFSPAHFREFVELLLGFYVVVAALVSLAFHGWLLTSAGKTHFTVAAVALCTAFVVSGAMRIVDWGAFLYSLAHVDEEFWRVAFDPGNLKLLQSKPAVVACGVVAAGTAALFVLLRWSRRWVGAVTDLQAPTTTGTGGATTGALLLANVLGALLLLVTLDKAWLLAWEGPPREITSDVQAAFSGIPELKVIQPLLRIYLSGPPPEPARLSPDLVRKVERAGLRLYSTDPRYPLMKRSIYLDPLRRRPDTPRVPIGTNVIIFTVESLSRSLLDERVHHVAGLTPNFDDFRRHSLTLTNLFSADFPTIKGTIATFGSFAFDHRGLAIYADTNNPLKSNYLLLSDILGPRFGYETVHAQSDLNSFANIGTILRRHHYDACLGGESPEILAMLRHPITKPWGVFDEDLLTYVVSRLEHRDPRRPLYLTLAPTDMHFPYTNIAPFPGTSGNDLLNAVHGTDKAFGIFWEYFKRSPYRDNTIVLVTADHAMATQAFRSVDANRRISEFDYLAAMLYVPGADSVRGTHNDTVCTQLDIAPTLLDMLGVDIENPFLGLSIFAERPNYPLALSRELPFDPQTGNERAIVKQLNWTAEDHASLFGLLRSLAALDRIRPVDSGAKTPAP